MYGEEIKLYKKWNQKFLANQRTFSLEVNEKLSFAKGGERTVTNLWFVRSFR